MAIKVGSIGYNFDHDKNFHMDKPLGSGAYLLLFVKTDAKFTINRKAFYVKENSYILFNPTTPCSYKPVKDLYIDDWYHFMRQFKEQTCMTPTEYRNQSSWIQIEKSRG